MQGGRVRGRRHPCHEVSDAAVLVIAIQCLAFRSLYVIMLMLYDGFFAVMILSVAHYGIMLMLYGGFLLITFAWLLSPRS